MSLYVKMNTFPVLEYPVDGKMKKVPHAEPGDAVRWEGQSAYGKHNYCLIRGSDNAVLWSISITKKDQILPPRSGIVRENKSKGYVMILEEK